MPVDTAMSYIADDIVCDAPTGRLEGTEAFRKSHEVRNEVVEELLLV